MGWNEPENGGKSPWGGKQQPPDLEEMIKQVQKKLKTLFATKTRNTSNSRSRTRSTRPPGADAAGIRPTMLVGGVIAVLLWAVSGIFIVDPAEQAAILHFGRYVETVGPGPHWIARFISSKVVLNVDRVSDYSYSAQMLTRDENLVSVAVAVQYRIGDLQDYLFNVADVESSLQQATSSALRQVVGTTTLDQMITEGRDAWGSSVQDTLVKLLARYKTGIIVVNVSPQPARAPENVQDAFDDAIKAQEDEKRFKELAGAYAARVVPIAEGNATRIHEEAKAYAAQVVLRATGETAEFLALLPEYLRSPEVTSKRMYLESMQKVLSMSSKIMVDTKAGNILYLPLEQMMQHANNYIQPAPAVSLQAQSSSESFGTDSSRPPRSIERPGRIS